MLLTAIFGEDLILFGIIIVVGLIYVFATAKNKSN
jgi:hypothetical protein